VLNNVQTLGHFGVDVDALIPPYLLTFYFADKSQDVLATSILVIVFVVCVK